MKNTLWIVGGLVVVGSCVGLFVQNHWLSLLDRTRHERFPVAASQVGDSTTESSINTAEEVARLRRELERKNALLLALASAPKDEMESAEAVAAMPTSEADPWARAVDLLDERLFTSPRDPRLAGQMERELREVASSTELGDAKISSLYCGSSLCKLTLSSENETVLNRSMAALGGRLPKTFGSTVVYEQGKGQSALYVGRSSQELELDTSGVQGERGPLVMHEGNKPESAPEQSKN